MASSEHIVSILLTEAGVFIPTTACYYRRLESLNNNLLVQYYQAGVQLRTNDGNDNLDWHDSAEKLPGHHNLVHPDPLPFSLACAPSFLP